MSIVEKIAIFESHLANIAARAVALEKENGDLKAANSELQTKADALIAQIKKASDDAASVTTLSDTDNAALDALGAHIAALDTTPAADVTQATGDNTTGDNSAGNADNAA